MGVNELLRRRKMFFNAFQSKIFPMRNTNINDDYYNDYHYYDNNGSERRLMPDFLTTPTIIIDPSPERPTQGSRIKILSIQRFLILLVQKSCTTCENLLKEILKMIYSLYQANQISKKYTII